jgi:peptidoglycan hydrolase-like protein with peptidoglycan-binding domain
LIGPVDLFRTKDAISVQPPKPIKEAAIPTMPEVERNPSDRSDAIWMQTRLHDLGYFAGNTNGVWGSTSRSALRDFKAMNGLAENDKWDQETEQRLLAGQNVPASSTFIGGWAQSVEECQRFRGGGAPLVIRPRSAETDRVKCSFRSVKRDVAAMWHVQAACSAEGQSWNANVSLKLTGSNLKWSSERGSETYVRCLKP